MVKSDVKGNMDTEKGPLVNEYVQEGRKFKTPFGGKGVVWSENVGQVAETLPWGEFRA
jgi:hypothetical protein